MIVFIARRLFVCSRLVVVQIQTYHQTNILGELDFFLSLRKKRQNKNRFFTRSWFYFTLFRRQKRRSFGEKKQQQKSIIALRLHTTERDSSQDLTFTDSFIKHSLFTGPLLSCKHHSIDHKETTNAEGVCRCQGDCLLGASVKFQSGKKERL